MEACLHFTKTIQHNDKEIDIEMGCGGTGKVFGGLQPFILAECIVCKGTGFIKGKPIGDGTIQAHNLGLTTNKIDFMFAFEDFPEGSLMAHVMHKAGIFPSVSQARKNGWNAPIERGQWTVSKKKIKVTVK